MKKEFIIGAIGFAILAIVVIFHDWNHVEELQTELEIRRELRNQIQEPTLSPAPTQEPETGKKPRSRKVRKPKRKQCKRTYVDCSLSKDVQDRIMSICKKRYLSYSLVMAVIEQESDYDTNCISDGGNSIGLMQIQPVWYQDKIKKLGITDLKDPIQNVKLGTMILQDLMERYEDVDCALMAYNMGEPVAKRLWSKGTYESKYSIKVRDRQKRIEKESVDK